MAAKMNGEDNLKDDDYTDHNVSPELSDSDSFTSEKPMQLNLNEGAKAREITAGDKEKSSKNSDSVDLAKVETRCEHMTVDYVEDRRQREKNPQNQEEKIAEEETQDEHFSKIKSKKISTVAKSNTSSSHIDPVKKNCSQSIRCTPRMERSHSDSDVGRLALRLSMHSNSEDSDTTGESNSQPNTATVQPTEHERARNISLIRNIARGMADNDIDDDFFEDFGIVPMELMEIPQPNVPITPQFAVGESREEECQICLSWKSLHLRLCCKLPTCDECMEQYCAVQVGNGIVKIQCVNPACDHYMHRDEILARLSGQLKDKFYKFLVDANKDPHIKTCPRCSHVMTINIELLRNPKHKKRGLKVVCPECFLVWCFPCQAPWHGSVTCKEFRRGDKLLLKWAREHVHGQANAQKCPKCKVFIQRSAGCDHMVCTHCKTNFCYRCGDKYREMKFVGDHYSRFSILGCKYRFKPDSPVERKFVRGAIFGCKLLVAPVVGGLALAGGAALLGISVLALPFYAGYKIHKQIEMEKRRKLRRQAVREWRAMVEAIRKKGEELEISMHQTKSDNLDELMASYNEHSHADDLDPSQDDSDSSSDLDSGVKITEVKVITEIINPSLLEDRNKNCNLPGDSTDIVDGNNTVPSAHNNLPDCDKQTNSEAKNDDKTCILHSHGNVSRDREHVTREPVPLTWQICLERAPYADEESFSITDVDELDYRLDTKTEFICHL